MRALMTTMDLPPTLGGIQTMAREILANAAGVTYTVVAPADPGHERADRSLPARVVRVRAVAPRRRGYIPGIALAAIRETMRATPDVVLSLHVNAALGPASLKRAPLVVVAHGGELRSHRIARAARYVFARADRVIAVSRFTRSTAVALGADPMRTTVIPVGAPAPLDVHRVDVQALRARYGGGRIVLSVARLEKHKGHDRLIEAVAGLPDDVRLVIVGDGPARAELEQRAAPLRGRAFFAGRVDDEELAVHYAAADVFALLSRETPSGVEGGGIALLEACAYGLPVVAGASGGIPETILDGETGLLVNPDDVAAVTRALGRLLADAELSERLRTNARAMALGERSWRAFVARVEDVLEAAVRTGRR